MKIHYLGKPVNINIQSFTNNTQNNNWVLAPPKNGEGKLPFFCFNVEQVITVYGWGEGEDKVVSESLKGLGMYDRCFMVSFEVGEIWHDEGISMDMVNYKS